MNHIPLPKQPVTPSCRNCTRCGGNADGHFSNGKICVYCRTDAGWLITPLRGLRTKHKVPCEIYQPKSMLKSLAGATE